VNRAGKKIEGPLGKKNAQEQNNRRRVSGRGVGAEGMVTKSTNWHKPESWNQIQTLKDCLYCHIYCAQPLGPQSLNLKEFQYPRCWPEFFNFFFGAITQPEFNLG